MYPEAHNKPWPNYMGLLLERGFDAHLTEDQAGDAEKRGDTEQAMGWFADSMRLRDVINVVTSIEIPIPEAIDTDGEGLTSEEPPLAA